MKANYHTHTQRCKHAGGSARDYLLKALENKMSILGFSDHAPYPDDRFGLRMDFCELEDYIREIEELKLEFKDDIVIKCGLEIEYDFNQKEYYKKLLNDYKLDYLALGQHIYAKNNKHINVYSLKDTSQYLEYANTIIEGMKTGYFKFLAHPDVIFINDLKWDYNCDKFCDLLINAALENDFIFEFNANGIRRGEQEFCDGNRYPYPHKNFWKKVSETNIKVIINSDCHSPEQVWDNYMEIAYKIAKSWNLNIITEIF